MPDGLYEHDSLLWSERQAALLRRLAAGERVNDAVDWPRVIEEVGDVGLSGLRACRSLLRQALIHLLKLHAWPDNPAAAHWRGEAGVFLADAEDCFTPSMHQRIELDALYAKALSLVEEMADTNDGPRPLPDACPFTLEDLLGGRIAVAALVAKLDGSG